MQPVEELDTQMELGECPLWDHRHQKLYWVDIIKCVLFQRDWSSGSIRTWPLPSLGGGLGLLGENELIVATQTGLFGFDPTTGEYRFLLHPEPATPDNRLNEGKTDSEGRYWIGSICTLGRRPQGALYRVGLTHGVKSMLSGIHVPNALVFLPDCELLFTDSHMRLIWRFRIDPANGELIDRRMFADDTDLVSIPDGVARASDGSIWNAKFGGGRIVAYSDLGRHVGAIELPVTQVTSCAFAGPELDVLVVTTAKRLLDEQARKAQPRAGNLFIFKPGVVGTTEPICRL